MIIRLLGPVDCVTDDGPIALGSPAERFVFAVLALEAGRVISLDRLIALTWRDDPPRTARATIQVRISRLRAALGSRDLLHTEGSGYRLDVDPSDVDVHRFARLTHAASDTADDTEAARLLREARRLWRGPALAGIADNVDSDQLTVPLEQARLAAAEQLAAVELRSAGSTELLGELQQIVAAHPEREHAVELLALASLGAGQPTRALDTLATYRRRLADELGLDPSQRLQDLQTQLLRGEPPEGLRAASPVLPYGPEDPAANRPVITAPRPPAGFRGRDRELNSLTELAGLAGPAGPTDRSGGADEQRVLVITGMPGAGKTALALQWAEQVAEDFPDGRLYLDLGGHADQTTIGAADAATQLLRDLGTDPATIPDDPEDRRRALRARLEDRRILIILDNAADAGQVRPLLPPSTGALTLVTSRQRLDGLVAREGARRILAPPLDPQESAAVLTAALTGQDAPDPAIRELAEVCAGLPLALRIAAASIDDGEIEDYLRLVRRERLDAFRLDGEQDESVIRAAFDYAFTRLPETERRGFTLLGVLPTPEVTTSGYAALLDIDPESAAGSLRRLERAHLLERPTPDRYRLHDLLDLYATDLADRYRERDAARARFFDHAVYWTRTAIGNLLPEHGLLPLPDGALSRSAPRWQGAADPPPEHRGAFNVLRRAQHVLVATASMAVDIDPATTLLLADALRPYFDQHRDRVAWRQVIDAATVAAEQADRAPLIATRANAGSATQASLEMSNAMLAATESRFDDATDHLRRALTGCRAAGWEEPAVEIGILTAKIHYRLDRPDAAIEELAEAGRQAHHLGKPVTEAWAEVITADALQHSGRLAEAESRVRAAVEVLEREHALLQLPPALLSLSGIADSTGATDDPAPVESTVRARDISASLGQRNIEVLAEASLSSYLVGRQRYEEAAAAAHSALQTSDELGDHVVRIGSRTNLAVALRHLGRFADASDYHRRAIELSRQYGETGVETGVEIDAVVEAAITAAAADQLRRAEQLVAEGLELTVPRGILVETNRLLLVRARIQMAEDLSLAAETASKALAALRRTGDRRQTEIAAALVAEIGALQRPGIEPASSVAHG